MQCFVMFRQWGMFHFLLERHLVAHNYYDSMYTFMGLLDCILFHIIKQMH